MESGDVQVRFFVRGAAWGPGGGPGPERGVSVFNWPIGVYVMGRVCAFFFKLVGGPCGHHGPYTFYKAFRYTKNGVRRIMTLSEFFFVKLWIDSDLLCIGELQLLWMDKNSDQVLSSLRLYFLPENTPEGRMDHGEVSPYAYFRIFSRACNPYRHLIINRLFFFRLFLM